jgi:hypothetical protein
MMSKGTQQLAKLQGSDAGFALVGFSGKPLIVP